MADTIKAQFSRLPVDLQQKVRDFFLSILHKHPLSPEVTALIDLTAERACDGFGPACKVIVLVRSKREGNHHFQPIIVRGWIEKIIEL